MRTFCCAMLLVLVPAGLGWAQGRNQVVEARAVLATDAAHANSTVKMAVVAQINAGYHINDHKPTLDYLIPTQIKLDPTDQVTMAHTVFPKGTLRKFSFSDVSLSVYEGTIIVGAVLQVAKAVPPGDYTLTGKFAYQACNDHACLPPASIPLTLTVKVVPRSVALKPENSDVFERFQFE